MYSNDYSAYPQILGSTIGVALIFGSAIAFIRADRLRRSCAIAFGLTPALVVTYVLAKEQVTDLYTIGLSGLVSLFFMSVWGVPALVSYKVVRHFRRRIAREDQDAI